MTLSHTHLAMNTFKTLPLSSPLSSAVLGDIASPPVLSLATPCKENKGGRTARKRLRSRPRSRQGCRQHTHAHTVAEKVIRRIWIDIYCTRVLGWVGLGRFDGIGSQIAIACYKQELLQFRRVGIPNTSVSSLLREPIRTISWWKLGCVMRMDR